MFKIRASASGKLMTESRTKTEPLSKTTQTYLQEWFKESLYGVQKEISSKYLDKGIALEDEAIDKVIEWLDLPFAMKNEEQFENEYFKGTPDLIVNDTVFDIKCSWDCFTFPLFESEMPNKDYYYQLQVYMALTGLKKAMLCYVLVNTPEDLTWEQPHDYSNVDKSLRLKTFEVTYDQSVIDSLIEKVKLSRSYLQAKKESIIYK